MMMRKLLLLFVVLIWIGPAQSAPWSGILPDNRGMDWSKSGADPAIMNATRTQCVTAACNTLAGGTVTKASIEAAIASAPANTYVQIPTATVTIASLTFNGADNVTLRGNGPLNTIIRLTGSTGCSLLGAAVCIGQSTFWHGGSDTTPPAQTRVVSSGYTQGSTQLVVSASIAGSVTAGMVIVMDQCDVSAAAMPTVDDGGINNAFNATIGTIFNNEVSNPAGRHDTGDCTGGAAHFRSQHEYFRVVSVPDSTHINIDPPVRMPNWTSGQNPEIWWWTGGSTGAGLENITIDTAGIIVSSIEFGNCWECWIKNVRLVSTGRCGFCNYQSGFTTVSNSYMYDTAGHGARSYSVENFGGGAFKAENIIVHNQASAFMKDGTGSVFAYNYVLRTYLQFNTDVYNTKCMVPGHDAGGGMSLYEGNICSGVVSDLPHGNSPMSVHFRNFYHSNDASNLAVNHPNYLAFKLQRHADAVSIVGNVLGHPTISTFYRCSTVVGDCPQGVGDATGSLFEMGYGGTSDWAPGNDTGKVRDTALLWGNYDTVNDSTRFQASDIPTTAIPRLAGASVPGTQTLANSWYLPARPSWFATPWGTSKWPPIGPDVTGGNHPYNAVGSGIAGHVDKTPAMLCYENLPQDTNYPFAITHVDRGLLAFDARTCYGAGSDTTPPAAPTGVTISRPPTPQHLILTGVQ